jgi:hypothetical protein
LADNVISDVDESARRGFATELLKLCEAAYAVELTRKADLEKKAQFYLALITGLLGILTLNDKLGVLVGQAASRVASSGMIAKAEIGLFFLLILAALFCILRVVVPRRYEQPYPRDLLTYLYRAESKFKTEAALIHAKAEEFAWATELSFLSNVEKSKWLLRLSLCVFLILVQLAVILMTLTL